MGKLSPTASPRIPLSPHCPSLTLRNQLTPLDTAIETIQYNDTVPKEWFSPLSTLQKTVAIKGTPLLPEATLDTVIHRIIHSESFLRSYHSGRGDSDITISTWSHPKAGVRKVSTTITVFAPFETRTSLQQGQRFALGINARGNPTVVWHFSSQTPNVTCGSCFRSEVLMEFEAVAPSQGVVVTTYM
eukprot:PhF_6_TR43369/c0_g1_i2/m.66490